MAKLDFKKLPQYKAKKTIDVQKIPPQNYLAFDGSGYPGDDNKEWAAAIPALYAASYAIRMSHKAGNAPKGYQEYTVGPLEGLWWVDGAKSKEDFRQAPKSEWKWTIMIPQPEFVTKQVAQQFIEQVRIKKPDIAVDKLYFKQLDEKLAVQVLYVGPYDEETETIDAMIKYAEDNGYAWAGDHHEIYLSDARRVAPEKLKTIIRHPVKSR